MAKFTITYFLSKGQESVKTHRGSVHKPGDVLLTQVWEGSSRHGAFHHAMKRIDQPWGNTALNNAIIDYHIEPYRRPT